MKKPSILFIGNHFRSPSTNPNIWHEMPDRFSDLGWEVLKTSKKTNRSLRLLDMLLTIFKQRKSYDIAEVDVFSGPAFTWAFLSASLLKLINKPFVLNLHGGNLPEYSIKHPSRMRKLLMMADQVVAPSAYLQETLSGFGKRIGIIPNPIEIGSFNYSVRSQINLALIWIRAFHEIYNPELAVQVLANLAKSFPDVHLTMIGPDKGDGSFQKVMTLAAQLQVKDQISLTGAVSKAEVRELLAKNDIFINTTNFDNTPLSVIEAMAHGLAIVSTNVGGIPWLLEDQIDSLLVPPRDPEAMTNAILRLLKEPGLAEKLSVNARKKAERFDWSIVLPQWVGLFTKVLETNHESEQMG